MSVSFTSCQGEDVAPQDVPSVVTNTLMSAFPNATDLDWEKKNGSYEADFDIDTVDYEALLDASGKMLQVKHEITEVQLPETVKNTISQNYKDTRIDDAEMVEKGSDKYYQVELESSGPDQKLVFSADGVVQTDISYWD
ncbi:PepSY-like domain-containing protein [Pontibacter sp. 172403-2]|nr:PepSY-like domain-containing protein [Pontibacter sp. 172403-2]